jgi:hypothetical protein
VAEAIGTKWLPHCYLVNKEKPYEFHTAFFFWYRICFEVFVSRMDQAIHACEDDLHYSLITSFSLA